MAAVNNIVLPDALVTPVNHTFVPIASDSKGVWWFEDQSAASPIGFQRLSVSLTRPAPAAPGQSAANRVMRVKIGIYLPRLEVVANSSTGLTPSPTVAYQLSSKHEILISERSSLQDRKDSRKYAVGIFNEPQIVAMIENLQNIY